MTTPNYMNRCLRHRKTGAVAVVSGQSSALFGVPLLRLKFGDGSVSARKTVAQVEGEWEWVEGVTAGPSPAVALPDNVVPFKQPWRVVPIDPGSGDAA